MNNSSKKLGKYFSAKQSLASSHFSKANLTVVALLFAAIGGYLIYSSFAAGFSTSFEAENSTKNSPATTVSDAGASGGSALKFAKAGNCLGTAGQPDGADPWGTCWPGPLTTGVPAGTTLTNVPGQITSGAGWAWDGADQLIDITGANAILSGLNVSGGILVDAPGVTIKNSKIVDGFVHVDDNTNHSLTIQDSDIKCPHGNTALGEAFLTVRRVNIHDCENGFDANQSIDVQDSYIHDQSITGHDDGLQMASGHFTNGQVIDGALNLNIIHNTIYGHNDDFSATKNQSGDFGTSAIISNPSGATNILIQHNLMAGGAYTLYCPESSTNFRVLDNRFSNIFIPQIGYFGPITTCYNASATFTGNVFNENGCWPENNGPCVPYTAGELLPRDDCLVLNIPDLHTCKP